MMTVAIAPNSYSCPVFEEVPKQTDKSDTVGLQCQHLACDARTCLVTLYFNVSGLSSRPGAPCVEECRVRTWSEYRCAE